MKLHLVKSMNLDHGLQISLIALNAVLNSLMPDYHVPARNQLNAFVIKVHAAVLTGQLSTADALNLMQSAKT